MNNGSVFVSILISTLQNRVFANRLRYTWINVGEIVTVMYMYISESGCMENNFMLLFRKRKKHFILDTLSFVFYFG